ncbi:hypothetical protein BH09PSE5_BH09PSE5_43360 [soil metagenome]
MKTLYLRIYATLVVVLLLFALVAGWLFSRNMEHRRIEVETEMTERIKAWGDLAQNNLPAASAPVAEQRSAVLDWSNRLGLAIALDDVDGSRIAASPGFAREEALSRSPGGRMMGAYELPMDDGRTLWVLRRPPPSRARGTGGRDGQPGGDRSVAAAASGVSAGRPSGDARDGPAGGMGRPPFAGPDSAARDGSNRDGNRGFPPDPRNGSDWRDSPGGGPGPGAGGPNAFSFGIPGGGFMPPPPGWDRGPGRGGPPGPPSPWWFASTGNLVAGLAVLFIAVAAGAWPVVRRLTRRLESLKLGVEAFGAGALDQRVKVDGNDEVAALATSFNQAASQVEALVRSHQSLLANASHELRSPLARMKMAVSLMDLAPPEQRPLLKSEIDTNIAELDSLVEEVLLASRLDAADSLGRTDDVDLLALAAEEAGRAGASAEGESVGFNGSERLLKRALRNLLENAKRYGGGDVVVVVSKTDDQRVLMRVCDRGPGVPPELRERIFEPFYRLPGHAEQAGGVGLGLSLVRQIAERHGGSVHWEPRDGGGSCFVIALPMAKAAQPAN